MKKQSIVESIVALLVFLFLYTGINKLLDLENFRYSLDDTPFVKNFSGIISIGLPVFEIVLSVLLVIPKTRIKGLYLSTGLLLFFIVYLIVMLSFVKRLPCGCGGVISQLSWKQHIFFNLFFAILSALAIRLQKSSQTQFIQNKINSPV